LPELIPAKVWDVLTCSSCGHSLSQINDGAKCASCGLYYPFTESGSLDLRLQKPKSYPIEFVLGTSLLPEDGFNFDPLQPNPSPEVDFSGTKVPRHLTKEILSYFPKARTANSLMLDLGCGKSIHKGVAERAGFGWVGLDYETPGAPILGDAQSLPFEDKSFEFILCVTVIQYIRYPFVMIQEAQRVLKPGGILIGTVAFLEPSHGTSFYHHSHLGTYNLLQQGGFTVEKVAPSAEWSSLKAQASMGMFFMMPRPLAQAVVYPLELLHRLWWWGGSLIAGRPLENTRIRHFTGSLTFVASKKT